MNAVTFSQFGAANEVLTVSNVATPDSKPGEVLVRLAISAVNPSDVKKRAGAFPDLLSNGPVIPHSDGAWVPATGSNAVDNKSCHDAAAECVVNHRESGWAQRLLDYTQGQAIDRVIDVEFGENLPEVLNCIRIGGTVATDSSSLNPEPMLPFRTMMFMDLTVRLVIVYDVPEFAKAKAVADTKDVLRDHKLTHRVAHYLPAGNWVQAHELIERGDVRGCVVVEL